MLVHVYVLDVAHNHLYSILAPLLLCMLTVLLFEGIEYLLTIIHKLLGYIRWCFNGCHFGILL